MDTNLRQNVRKNKCYKTWSEQFSENLYRIDSLKLLADIDDSNGKIKINIPENYVLVDKDTGEELEEFKKKSLKIPFRKSNIYLGKFVKLLPQRKYEKIVILLSSKANKPSDYFQGVTKKLIIEVLSYLKEINRLEFDNSEYILKQFVCRDIDVKKDLIVSYEDWEKFNFYGYTVHLHDHKFTGRPDRCKKYNSKAEGTGIQCNYRDNSSYTKPFVKFYDKSKELKTKSENLFLLFDKEMQKFIETNNIYRYEYTIKNKDYLKKLKISDKLPDILSLNQKELSDIGNQFFNSNFTKKMKKENININDLNSIERSIARLFIELEDNKTSYYRLRELFTVDTIDKKHRDRREKKFDKIYSAVNSKSEEAALLKKEVKNVKNFNTAFNLGY